jgi:RNA polymerase sigma-70 factor, ECF subfamily
VTVDTSLRDKTDPELLQRLSQHDRTAEQALAILMARHAPALAARSRRVLDWYTPIGDVEEVVSDAFLDAWLRSHEYVPERGPVLGWLKTLVLYRCLAYRRHRRSEAELPPEDAPEFSVPDETMAVDAALDAQQVLGPALEDLRRSDPQDAELLILCYVDELSPTEIAERLELTAGATRTRLLRARRKLRALIDQQSALQTERSSRMAEHPKATAKILERLAQIHSTEQLRALVGDITPEERKLLAAVQWEAEPTAEELAALGPDFVERLRARTLARLHEHNVGAARRPR